MVLRMGRPPRVFVAVAFGQLVSCSTEHAPSESRAPSPSGRDGGGDAARDAMSDAGRDAETGADGGAAPWTIPVAFDAFRRWGELAALRVGTRTYMRSTYDRSG